MVAGAAAASRAPADAVTPTSASRRVKVFPMGAVIADGPIRCCGKTRLSGPSLVASYRQNLGDQAGAVSHKAVCGQCPSGRRYRPYRRALSAGTPFVPPPGEPVVTSSGSALGWYRLPLPVYVVEFDLICLLRVQPGVFGLHFCVLMFRPRREVATRFKRLLSFDQVLVERPYSRRPEFL